MDTHHFSNYQDLKKFLRDNPNTNITVRFKLPKPEPKPEPNINTTKHYREYGDAPTVKEVVQELLQKPLHAKCYVRTKYHGNSKYSENIPLNHAGISEMHPVTDPPNVTFLI